MIDEISIVSSDLWTEIDARFSEVFSASIELPFAGLSVVVIGDYLQLPTVIGRFIFSMFTNGRKNNKLLSLQLLRLLKFA